MASTTSTTVASAIQTKWMAKLLTRMKPRLIWTRFGDVNPVGKGINTVKYNWLLDTAKVTSSSSAGTALKIGDSALAAFTTNYRDITMQIWEKFWSINDNVDVNSFLTNDDYMDSIVDNYERTLDYQVLKALVNESFWVRQDGDATYQVRGTVDSATASTVVDAALTQADDHWNGGMFTVYNRTAPGFDTGALVTDFVASTDTLSVALTNTPTSASRYNLVTREGIVAGDKLIIDNLLNAAYYHDHLGNPKLPGGKWLTIIDSIQHRDLHDDTEYAAYIQNDRSELSKDYQDLVPWYDQVLKVTDEPYRTDANGTENQASGVCHHAITLGADAYAIQPYEGWGGTGVYNSKMIMVTEADSYNVNEAVRTIGWKAMVGMGTKRATRIVTTITGGTALLEHVS